MAEIAPPSRVPPPPAPGPAPQASVPAPPAKLVAAEVGTRLEALVLAVQSDGTAEVKTDLGTFDIKPNVPLRAGSLVEFLLASKAPQVRLAVLSLDGRPPAQAAPSLPAATTSAPALAPGQAGRGVAGRAAATGHGVAAAGTTARAEPAAPLDLTVGSRFIATLFRLPATGPVPGQAPTAGPAIAGGTGGAAGALGNDIGTSAPAPTPATAPAESGTAVPPSPAAPTSAEPAPPTVPLPEDPAAPPTSPPRPVPSATGDQPVDPQAPPAIKPGSTVPVRLVAVTPPPAGQPAPTLEEVAPGPTVTLQVGQPVTGVVVGHASHPGGQATLVETRAGTFSLPTSQPLPAGTEVTLEALDAPTAPTVGADDVTDAVHPTSHVSDAELLFGHDWRTLQQSASALAETSPGAQQAILHMLTRPDTQLGAQLLFFVAALRGGDIRNWLGDGPMRVLDRLRPDLGDQLRDDFSRLARHADHANPGNWRIAAVPFMNENEIHRIRLLTRQPPEEEKEDEGGHGTRFVVDVTLSRLGRLQLDGLVARDGKRVDLLVRSEAPLPGRMRDDIRRIFQDAASLTGLSGGVGFQAQPAGFVDVRAGTAPAIGGAAGKGIEV